MTNFILAISISISITITINDLQKLIGFYPKKDYSPGYYALNNKQFSDCMSITSINFNTMPGASDARTKIGPDSQVVWKLESNKIADTSFMITNIFFHDNANFISIFKTQPQPIHGTKGKHWKALVKNYNKSNKIHPYLLSYRVQFTIMQKDTTYYFQFDPLVQTRDKD